MDANKLLEKIRKSRQFTVEHGGYKFIVRRPTDAEMSELSRRSKETNGAVSAFDVITQFVIGWEGVKELDLYPGGEPVPAVFDIAVWYEWCSDHPEFWEPLGQAVLDSYRRHTDSKKEAAKN